MQLITCITSIHTRASLPKKQNKTGEFPDWDPGSPMYLFCRLLTIGMLDVPYIVKSAV